MLERLPCHHSAHAVHCWIVALEIVCAVAWPLLDVQQLMSGGFVLSLWLLPMRPLKHFVLQA